MTSHRVALRRVRAGVASTFGLVCLAACTAPTSEPSTTDNGFGSLATAIIARANAAGASEAQLDALRDAELIGVLEFEPYKQAVDATFACFADAGIRYESSGPTASSGLPMIRYGFEAPENGPDPGSQCVNVNSRFVEELYQNQPAAAEAVEQAFIDAMPQLIPCLREDGWLPSSGEPSPDNVKHAIEDGMTAAEDGDAPMESNPMKCVIAAGLTDGFTPSG
ncbi:hypothetical protein [Demequina sp.]|uniref:hypothetical protein n=1 Tax=Demequina sp. TaxID=2050685 RepID=UPI003D09E96C